MFCHCIARAVISRIFHRMMDFRAIWRLSWYSLVSFRRLGVFLRYILHRCHLLEVRGCHLFLLVGLSAVDLLRGDTFECSSLSPLIISAELGHNIVDCLRVGVLGEALHRS